MARDRLDRLPTVVALGARVRLADTLRARLLGLALLEGIVDDELLLIPRCGSVHTFGMRFAIDVVFLDAGGAVLRHVEALPPRRLVSCRGARALIESRAGAAGRLLDLS